MAGGREVSGTQQMVVILAGELLTFFAVVMVFGDKRTRR